MDKLDPVKTLKNKQHPYMTNSIIVLLLKCYDYWDLNHDLQIIEAVMTVLFLVQSFIIKVFFPEFLNLNCNIEPSLHRNFSKISPSN